MLPLVSTPADGGDVAEGGCRVPVLARLDGLDPSPGLTGPVDDVLQVAGRDQSRRVGQRAVPVLVGDRVAGLDAGLGRRSARCRRGIALNPMSRPFSQVSWPLSAAYAALKPRPIGDEELRPGDDRTGDDQDVPGPLRPGAAVLHLRLDLAELLDHASAVDVVGGDVLDRLLGCPPAVKSETISPSAFCSPYVPSSLSTQVSAALASLTSSTVS